MEGNKEMKRFKTHLHWLSGRCKNNSLERCRPAPPGWPKCRECLGQVWAQMWAKVRWCVSWGVLEAQPRLQSGFHIWRPWCVLPHGQDGRGSSACSLCPRATAGERAGFRATHMEWGVRTSSQISCSVGIRTYWEETQGLSGYFLQGVG